MLFFNVNPGGVVNYTLVGTNTGDVTLTNVLVSDRMLSLNQTIASLAVEASQTITGSYTVPADAAAGNLINTATASTTYQETVLSESASATVNVVVDITDIIDDPVPEGPALIPNITIENKVTPK